MEIAKSQDPTPHALDPAFPPVYTGQSLQSAAALELRRALTLPVRMHIDEDHDLVFGLPARRTARGGQRWLISTIQQRIAATL